MLFTVLKKLATLGSGRDDTYQTEKDKDLASHTVSGGYLLKGGSSANSRELRTDKKDDILGQTLRWCKLA